LPVSLVLDSTADITPDDGRALGVEIVPILVVVGEQRLRDGIDIDRTALYRRMETVKELPTTEPPSVQAFAEAFKRQVDAGNDVVAMTVAAKLSGTYANACEAAKPFGDRVRVVDSTSASALFRLQAMEAIAVARAGGHADAVVQAGNRARLRGQAFFAIPDVSFLGRTGRLPRPLVALGGMMGVSLVLRVGDDGAVGLAGQSRSFERSQEIIVDQAVRALGDDKALKITIAHANAPDGAATLEALLRSKLRAKAEISTAEVGTVIAVNIGPGAVGICAIAT
jgi:DegV family protein with EDD domain